MLLDNACFLKWLNKFTAPPSHPLPPPKCSTEPHSVWLIWGKSHGCVAMAHCYFKLYFHGMYLSAGWISSFEVPIQMLFQLLIGSFGSIADTSGASITLISASMSWSLPLPESQSFHILPQGLLQPCGKAWNGGEMLQPPDLHGNNPGTLRGLGGPKGTQSSVPIAVTSTMPVNWVSTSLLHQLLLLA